ncbi:MAG: Hint domain-containing protein [Acidocella sp.]|uniref:Hint domain-containing protein n=1 Tax=Acidocella sp. TaxID=50710 RepID=UPI003FD81775
MTSRLNISVPATLTVLAGNATLSSMQDLPPGIAVSDPAGGTLTVVVQAGNSGAVLSAGTLSGNAITFTGSAAQVNAALAGLQLTESSGAGTDVLRLTASDPAALSAQDDIVVDVVPGTGPAFVNPAKIVTLSPDSLTALPNLLLSDPIAQGLAAMGLGQEETLSLTLSVAEGVLLLPGLTGMSGIEASGIGTGTIELSFTADEIGTLNTLLAGLDFAGPTVSGGQHLDYTLWNLTGVLPRAVTYGNIYLNTVGTPGANGTYTAGADTLIVSDTAPSGVLNVTGTMAVLGNLTVASGVTVAPGAAMEVPYNTLTLGGTSLDFGEISAATLVETGALVTAGGTSAGPVQLGSGALVDFSDGFTVDANAGLDYTQALSLAAGAVLEGAGTLTAGNFSAAGEITGPGTILALGGETLEVDAGLITGGTRLEVGAGGVMVLGEASSLYGIFDTTPLTVSSSVTLSFLGNGGAVPVSGGYAGTLGGAGGAFVITGPQLFSGTITGFAPGDELIFPGLSGFSVYNVSRNSFSVSGVDGSGDTQSYTISAAIPSGYVPVSGVDAEGDGVIYLRPSAPSVSSGALLGAGAGVAQPLLGLDLELAGTAAQSLAMTVSVAHGSLSLGTLAPAATLTLTAANAQAVNAELAGLTYTGTGVNDVLSFTGSTGLLAGLSEQVAITATGSGTVSGSTGGAVSAAEMVAYGPASGLSEVTAAEAVGGVAVSGAVEFNNLLRASGYSGTALLVDGGGEAIFGAAATAALAGGVTLNTGTLAVLGTAFSTGGNITLSGASEAVITGALTAAGSLALAGGVFDIGGAASLGGVVLGSAGSLLAYGTAAGSLGAVSNAGGVTLENDATLSAASYDGAGTLALGGTALFAVSGAMGAEAGAQLSIGIGATLEAGALNAGAMSVAGQVSIATSMSVGSVALAGGGITATSFAGGLIGYGVVDAPGISDTGTIEALGGRLLLAGSIANAGVLEVGASAALELSGPVSGAAVSFAGTNAELVLDDAQAGFSGVANMAGSDVVDLVGIGTSLVSYSAGTIGVFDSLGSEVTSFTVQAVSGQPGVSIVSDGAGGSLITLRGEMPCFARGTRLLSPHGYRAVEELRPGDPLITASGERRPVRWIGWRTLDLGPAPARNALPVLIMPGAFGPGRPHRVLRLSPLHCVYADGVLIPVTHLVNGATIIRERAAAATYFHVELDRHDILLAEGLECESYFCSGNRGALYHELGRRSPAARPFAPNVTSGVRLAAVRRRLHGIVLQAGFSPAYLPQLRAISDTETVIPEISRAGHTRLAQLHFARPVEQLTLLAGASAPAETDPDSEDWRELSLCLGDMLGVSFGPGWQPRAAGDTGIWMGPQAELRISRARRRILLPLAAISCRWRKPPVDAWRLGV